MVTPKLEYACSIWDPHHANLSNMLESVQNRAARFIFDDYSSYTSVTGLKSNANLSSLEDVKCPSSYYIASFMPRMVTTSYRPLTAIHLGLIIQSQYSPCMRAHHPICIRFSHVQRETGIICLKERRTTPVRLRSGLPSNTFF